jgi:hypothetical protein
MPAPKKILDLVVHFREASRTENNDFVFDLYGLSEEERKVVLNS